MVPGFILKLWKMINDRHCDDLISWSDNGQSFIIMDPPKFSQELSKYFKHNNLSSFIRQLNMYGFRKVSTIENSGLHPGVDDLHFYHPDFLRDKPDRLEAIKRKLPQKLSETVELKNVIKGITEIEDKQKGVTKTLADIKRENEMLWAELHDLRQKHQQQQLYITRLMKLVFEAMEQNGIKTNMLQLKRNEPLMIEASDEAQLMGESVPIDGNQQPDNIASSVYQQQQQQQQQLGDAPLTENAPLIDETNSPYQQPVATYSHHIPPNTIEQQLPYVLEQSINNTGDQIDQIVPTLMDFTDDTMDENLDAINELFND